MKTIFKSVLLLIVSASFLSALSWDSCIQRYNKAKQFSHNIHLSYNYLKSTKQCLIKFKHNLITNPQSEYTIQAMDDNIELLDEYINKLIPTYRFTNNTLTNIPKYLNMQTSHPTLNREYDYFLKFDQCNGVHAGNKIYTAKHCNIKDSITIRDDLSYLKTTTNSTLKTSRLDLSQSGTFKYYSMSKEGMFFNVLLKESNCKFFLNQNIPKGINITLDLADLNKKVEIRSSCLAVPSNSGGGVFQNNKLVAIISKTVFKNNHFLYSVVEPIVPIVKE